MNAIAFAIAALLFVLFVANVAAGALAGSPYLSDVAEMLLLFGAVAAFTVGALQSEARAEARDQKD